MLAEDMPLLITCLNTGTLAIHVMHQYSTSAFLIQWEHFVAVRGRPTWVHSDPGRVQPGSSLRERRSSTSQTLHRMRPDTVQLGSSEVAEWIGQTISLGTERRYL